MMLNTDSKELCISFRDDEALFNGLINSIKKSKTSAKCNITCVKDGYVTDMRLDTIHSRRLFDPETMLGDFDNCAIEVYDDNKDRHIIMFFDKDMSITNVLVLLDYGLMIESETNSYYIFNDLPFIISSSGNLAIQLADGQLTSIRFNAETKPGLATIKLLLDARESNVDAYKTILPNIFKQMVKFKAETIAQQKCLLGHTDILIRSAGVCHYITASLCTQLSTSLFLKHYSKEIEEFTKRSDNFYKHYEAILSNGLKRIEELK